MISKNQIRYIASLHLKKNREKERLFFVEGDKMVNELLSSSFTINSIYALEEWTDKHSKTVEQKNIELNIVTEAELKKISALTTPQQVFVLVAMPDFRIELNSLKSKLSLMLDEIKDPGNLGTIIRIADWFGIENVICSENTVDVHNPKVVQATMGSLFRVKIFYHDIISLLKENQNTLKLPVYAAVMNGKSVYDSSLGKQGLIVLGNESEGVGKGLLSFVNHTLTIPSFAGSSSHVRWNTDSVPLVGAESLNVAIATAIICSEFRRRNVL